MKTVEFKNPPSIIGTGCVVSKKEWEGPLGKFFKKSCPDPMYGEKNWEAAEAKFMKEAVHEALSNSDLEKTDIMISGDLQNQCTSSVYAARDLGLPYFGIYGACSTFSQGLSLGAMLVSAGYAENALASCSSHFCAAEKQFRTPLEYGGQRPPTSQWTVTGAGAAVIAKSGKPPFITHTTIGRLRDRGVTDVNNMGAAMAPAFVDTIIAHFKETGMKPSDYDLILSGDLGHIGKKIAAELAGRAGFDIIGNYDDCGALIFDPASQDVHAGGSGCACSAVVFCDYILERMRRGELRRVLFAATGAMMSPASILLGESIAGISYAVSVCADKT